MKMLWTRENSKLAGLVLLSVATLAACSGDTNDGFDESAYSEDKAILVGDVVDVAREASENSGGSVETNEAGQLTLSSPSINFDQTDVNTGSSVKELTIINTGQGNLRIDRFTLAEDQADSDREISPIGEDTLNYFKALQAGKKIYIAPDQSIRLSFEWKPVNTTPDAATLTIANNDPQKANQEVSLQTPMLSPELSVEAKVVFPRVAAGARGTKITTLLNSGESPLQLKDVVLSPASTTDFKLTFPDPANLDDESRDSSTWKSTLAPGEEVPMRVIFTPESDAPSNASVFVSSNDPNNDLVEIKLEGNAGTPCIKLGGVVAEEDQSSGLTHKLEFGESQIAQATEKSVTIENCSRTQELNVSDIAITDDGGGYFAIVEDSLPEGLDGDGAIIQPLQSSTFKVAYTPEAEEINEGLLILTNNDEVNAQLSVGLSGKGTNNVCPIANAEATIVGATGRPSQSVSTIPLKTIQFQATNSRDPDGSVQRYEWNIISAPVDSGSRLTPSNRIEDPKLFIDVAGEYEVELVVYDALGLASCESSTVTILAEPDEDIHVQLSWDTPADGDQLDSTGTDLDLHYMQISPTSRWNDPTYDVFWQNVEGEWGTTGADDNPSLDIDDTDGKGPENINHDNPTANQSYAVGVYYYDDNGFEASYATVRIYIEGQLKFEQRDKYMEKEDVFWSVATITWPSRQIFISDKITLGFPQ